jgi:hypothetical protein
MCLHKILDYLHYMHQKPSLWLTKFLGYLGGGIGENPGIWVSSFFLISMFCATGLQTLRYETGNEYLFVPHNSKGLEVVKFCLQKLKLFVYINPRA